MQFQDGRTRAMHLDYWDLFTPADRSYDVARGVVTALEAMAPEELRPTRRHAPPPISIAEQVSYFRELYPEGFRSDAYTAEHRTDGRKRLLKRHRDAIVMAADEHLSRVALQKTFELEGVGGVHESLRRVLEVSNLVSAKERKRFAGISPEHHGRVVDAARALIHGQAPLVPRFDAWVRALEVALGEAPSWELVTYFLAASQPDRLPLVRPTVVERQAQFMAPGLRVGDHPMGILYQRLVAMLNDVRERLEARGLEPRDLLDVYDVVWLTLKPAGRQRILQLRAERSMDDGPGEAARVAA